MKINEGVSVRAVMQTAGRDAVATGGRVVVAHPHDTFERAEELFLKHDVHHLPVVDDKGRLVGMVSARDILRCYAKSDEENPRQLVLANIMTEGPRSVPPNTSLRSAVLLLARAPFQSLPVVDPEGCPIGILTTRDIVAFLGDEYIRNGSA